MKDQQELSKGRLKIPIILLPFFEQKLKFLPERQRRLCPFSHFSCLSCLLQFHTTCMVLYFSSSIPLLSQKKEVPEKILLKVCYILLPLEKSIILTISEWLRTSRPPAPSSHLFDGALLHVLFSENSHSQNSLFLLYGYFQYLITGHLCVFVVLFSVTWWWTSYWSVSFTKIRKKEKILRMSSKNSRPT